MNILNSAPIMLKQNEHTNLLPFLYNCFRKGTNVPIVGHFCAISRHFYSTSIYKNSISIYKNGLRKNPSPFIYSRGMPINTGVPRLIGLFYPFITLHHPSSICHFQISTDRQSLPMLLFKAIICLLLRLARVFY